MKHFLTLTTLLYCAFSYTQTKHTASNYESIESVAKIYHFSPADILKLSPGVKDSMQKGTTINIPVNRVRHYSTQRPIGFTSHVVQPKETFFGLSRKYNIIIGNLKRYNLEPYSHELMENECMTIPSFSKTPEMVQKGVQGQERYAIKPQETLWRIVKNHSVSVEELERVSKKERGLNPDSLKEGQEIRVPASIVGSLEPTPNTAENNNKDLVLYSVKKGEGLYGLERKLRLSEVELIKLNPMLEEGLKTDARVWMPEEDYDRYKSSVFTMTNYSFGNSDSTLCFASSPANVKEILYILSFKVSGINSSDKSQALKARLSDNKITPVAADLYLGVLIALDSLQKMGYKFKVNILDSEGDPKEIASNAGVQASQLVIGSFTTKSFNTLASLLDNSDTTVLAPLANKNTTLNPNAYQTPPNDEALQGQMVNYLNKTYADENTIILIDNKNATLREKSGRTSPNAKVVTEMSANGFANAFNYSKENVVVLQPNDIDYVSLTVRLLHSALKVKKSGVAPKIALTTLERGSVFDSTSLSNNQLSNLHLAYPTVSKYINGNDTFSSRYLETYGILSSKCATRGFDLTMDAILRLGVPGNFSGASTCIGEISFLENKSAYFENAYKSGGLEN